MLYPSQNNYNRVFYYTYGVMRIENFKVSEPAVAGVVEAMLLVALFAIILSTIQLTYIPEVMEQREAEHMDQVSNQFSHLKSLIDIQALAGSMETDVPLAYVPMTSQITLGSRELPYFITARAFGELNIINDENDYNITVFPEIYPEGAPQNIFPLTSIKYEAYNSYFVDQTYVLEGGGIILDQPTGEPVMRADPSISIIIENENRITMRFYLPKIVGIPGKNSTYGHGKCFIRTNYSSHDTYLGNIPDGGHIRIYTDYLNAWNKSLSKLLEEEIKNGYVKVVIIQDPMQLVEITPEEDKEIDLELTVVNIHAQVGPGWIR